MIAVLLYALLIAITVARHSKELNIENIFKRIYPLTTPDQETRKYVNAILFG